MKKFFLMLAPFVYAMPANFNYDKFIAALAEQGIAATANRATCAGANARVDSDGATISVTLFEADIASNGKAGKCVQPGAAVLKGDLSGYQVYVDSAIKNNGS